MKVIAVVNQKGGVGKTTTAHNVGAALAQNGKSVLLIDADAQGNLSACAGFELRDDESSLYEVLKGANINGAIKTIKPGFSILPTDIRLSAAEIELSSVAGRELILKEALEELKNAYDYIIIDCAPSLSIITLMSLAAADYLIIPVQAAYLPLKGVRQLLDTVELVRKRINRSLELLGVVVTLYDSRKNLDKEVVENVRAAFGEKIFNSFIPNNVALAEAPAAAQDIFSYAPQSKGAEAYKALADEIIKRSL